MKILAGIVVASGLLLVPAAGAEAPAMSATQAASTHAVRSGNASITDFSAARRKRAAVTPAPAASAHPAWTGADPTRGPGMAQLRQLQAEGRCVIDEGYGRYTSCSNQ